MQTIKRTTKSWKISPLLFFAGTSFFFAFILAVCPFNTFQNKETKKPASFVKGISYPSPTQIPTNTPTQMVVRKIVASPTPTGESISNTSSQQPTQSPSQIQSTTPTASQPAQDPKPTVNLQIIEPDGTNNFSVTLNFGNNLCDNLTEAKNEGKIKSLTLDYSYMSTFHSAYLREMNGYSNNWTVSVNGKNPPGCSYTPAAGDSIVWKFG